MHNIVKMFVYGFAAYGTIVLLANVNAAVKYLDEWQYYKALSKFDEIYSFRFFPVKEEVSTRIWLQNGGFLHIGRTKRQNSLSSPDLTFLHQLGKFRLYCRYDGSSRRSWPTLLLMSSADGVGDHVSVAKIIQNYDRYLNLLSAWPRESASSTTLRIADNVSSTRRDHSNHLYGVASCWVEETTNDPNLEFHGISTRVGSDFLYFRDSLIVDNDRLLALPRFDGP